MAPPLSHTPPRVVDNFYQNSFKQLSMIQQKQVGLLVGAAVADAAARPLNNYTREEIEAHIQRVQHAVQPTSTAASPLSSSTSPASPSADDLVVFARVRPRGTELAAALPSSHAETITSSGHSLHFHSFSYLLYFEMLRAMSRARGDFPVEYVQEELVRAASSVHVRDVFEKEHASLLHTLCCLLPTPTIYPYASDGALRQYVDPFIGFLTAASVEPTTEKKDGMECSPAEAAAAERAAVRDFTASALGVVLRNLQSNPDSTRNGAFMAEPGAAAIFPTDVQPFVPAVNTGDAVGTRRAELWAIQQQLHLPTRTTSAAHPEWLPVRWTGTDAAVVRESLTIARAPISFAKGVAQAIHLGGPTCQRAMLVGALLGAKLGVRHIPLEWLSATPDHKPVATMALEVAQWSWNPPHH